MDATIPPHSDFQDVQESQSTGTRGRSTVAAGIGMSLPRFECSAPGCGRHFVRKEHLTRHAKSHGSRPQHQCPICGRRYMRSDVLKRHIEFHPQQSRGTQAACVACHKRKRKCDGKTPCQACAANGIDCVRPGTSPDPGTDDTPTTPAHLHAGTPDASSHGTNDGTDLMGPAWSDKDDRHPQPHYNWPLSSFSPANSTSALASPSQALTQWTLLADTPAPSPSSFSAAGSVDRPLAVRGVSPGVRGRSSEPVSVAATQGLAHASTPTYRSSPGTSLRDQDDASLSPEAQQDHPSPTLATLLRQDMAQTGRLVQTFFGEIHPYWPILHAPTFEAQSASDLLLGAMVMFAKWITGKEDHVEMASVVLGGVMAATSPESTPSLHTLQALLLCVVYATCRRSEQGMLAKAVRLNAVLVTTCRCLDIFHGRHTLPEHLQECALTFWLAEEQLHRLAFSVLRVDTYLSVLLDHPPSIRYQELCIPLPKSSQLWESATEEERRKLQWDEPAGRGKALFGYLMRDALADTSTDATTSTGSSHFLPYRLNRMDYHLGLCALQSGVWEAAREAHSAASDDIVTKLFPGAPIDLWRAHLKRWCTKMVDDCYQSNPTLSSPTIPTTCTGTATADPDSALTPLTLTLWHVSVIKMHAPLTLLRIHGQFVHGPSAALNPAAAAAMAAVQKPQARLRAWIASPCPRAAVWSAAQIARVVAPVGQGGAWGEVHVPGQGLDSVSGGGAVVVAARRVLLANPLAVPGLLMSAVVVCSYASQTRACLRCVPGSAGAGFDLLAAEINDPQLVRWAERGEGWAAWGPSGIPVCRCRLANLGEWFKEALPGDCDALRELEAFLEGLGG